jgi:hypothetical protein
MWNVLIYPEEEDIVYLRKVGTKLHVVMIQKTVILIQWTSFLIEETVSWN